MIKKCTISLQNPKTYIQVLINKVLRESGIEDRHLVAEFENTCVAGSRFERVGSEYVTKEDERVLFQPFHA